MGSQEEARGCARGGDRTGEVRFVGEVDNRPATIERTIKKLGKSYDRLHVGRADGLRVVPASSRTRSRLHGGCAGPNPEAAGRAPPQLMAFLGLVPGERSTGDTVRRSTLRWLAIDVLVAPWSKRPGPTATPPGSADQRSVEAPARGVAESCARHRLEGANQTLHSLSSPQRRRQEAAGGRGRNRTRDGRLPMGHRQGGRTVIDGVDPTRCTALGWGHGGELPSLVMWPSRCARRPSSRPRTAPRRRHGRRYPTRG